MITPKRNKLTPLLKYPGGKDKELGVILPNLPQGANRFFEPFVGGGAVYFAVSAGEYYINDKSQELIALYNMVKSGNLEFLDKLTQIEHNWQVITKIVASHTEEITDIYMRYKSSAIDKQKVYDMVSSFVLHYADEYNGLLSTDFNVGIQNFVNELIKSFKNKIIRMVDIEREKGDLSPTDFIQNIECAFKSAFYMHFRYLYNNAKELRISEPFVVAIYYYIREFCYSSMFRYNANGQFNVPYGGISYNKKSLAKKIQYLASPELRSHLQKTQLGCFDFEEYLKQYVPAKDDFMFVDPPYDTEFSTYAKNTFDRQDQTRLAEYLKNECDCYFMLVIKQSALISQLYIDGETIKHGRRIRIQKFDKKYSVSFQDRNNRNAEHLIITNY